MNLPTAFDTFLKTISLGKTPTERIESASNTLMKYLVDHYGVAPDDVFLQGSYPNDTAVEPADSDDGEYDVDLVAVCAAAGLSAEEALNTLEKVLAENGTYAEMLKKEGSRKKPCVRLRYADDDIGGFHVDVIPARASTSDDEQASLEVPRRGDGWHDTAPEEYTQWCRDQGERFARTVKMLKRWREVHQPARHNIKSIVLQVLAAENLGSQSSDAEALVSTLEAIQTVLAASPESPPRVENPVLAAENLAQRWEPDAYKNFLKELGEAVSFAQRALKARDEAESHELWGKLLGDDFPPPPSDPTKRRRVPPATPAPGSHPPQGSPRRERYGCECYG